MPRALIFFITAVYDEDGFALASHRDYDEFDFDIEQLNMLFLILTFIHNDQK